MVEGTPIILEIGSRHGGGLVFLGSVDEVGSVGGVGTALALNIAGADVYDQGGGGVRAAVSCLVCRFVFAFRARGVRERVGVLSDAFRGSNPPGQGSKGMFDRDALRPEREFDGERENIVVDVVRVHSGGGHFLFHVL